MLPKGDIAAPPPGMARIVFDMRIWWQAMGLRQVSSTTGPSWPTECVAGQACLFAYRPRRFWRGSSC
jgi:hypothetical protein